MADAAPADSGRVASTPKNAGQQNVFRTADFIDIIGINTHPDQGDTYANTGNVIADIQYRHSSLTIRYPDGRCVSHDRERAGIQLTVCVVVGGTVTTSDIASMLAPIDQLNEAVPGSIAAIEGPNEINNWPLTYNGATSILGAEAFQKDLYSAVHADAHLLGVPVVYFTSYQDVSDGPGLNPATKPGYADYDNAHPYPPGVDGPDSYVNPSWMYAIGGNESAPFGPAMYTELGYSLGGDAPGTPVDADTQARYTLDIVADAVIYGLSRVYIYQLIDESFDTGLGLFDTSNTARPAADALHNLNSVLADTGADATTFATVSFAYSVSNLPNTKETFALQKSTGEVDILVWNESSSSPVDVVVQLPNTYQTVTVFDPMSGTAPIQTLANTGSVSVAVSNYPMIVQTSAHWNSVGMESAATSAGEAFVRAPRGN